MKVQLHACMPLNSLCRNLRESKFCADVWLSQAKNVQELGWLLHLSGQVLQLPIHRQQALWERLQELFWVRVTGETPCVGEHGDLPHLCPALTNCYCSADSVKHDLETSAMPACCWWKGGKSSQWEPRRTGIMWVAGYIFVIGVFYLDAYEAVKISWFRLLMHEEVPA